MNSAPAQLPAPLKSRLPGSTIAVVAGVALGTVLLLTAAGQFVTDSNTATVVLAALVFFGLLAFAAAYGRARSQPVSASITTMKTTTPMVTADADRTKCTDE